jgi:hypothetical protein
MDFMFILGIASGVILLLLVIFAVRRWLRLRRKGGRL